MRTPLVFLTLAGLMALTSCSTTTTKVNGEFIDPNFRERQFNNVLVIGAADDYDMRAQFERTVVSLIRQTGAEATAYYTVLGHNPPLTSSDIENAVRSRGFDAVLFTRVKGSAQQVNVKEATGTAAATTKGGNLFDLFRYDYEEFDEPDNVRVSTDVQLLTELYAAEEQKKVWVAETASHDRESAEQIIDSEARAIVRALEKNGLIGPP